MIKLNKKFEFEQDGKTYSLYNLPDGFVIKGDIDLEGKGLTELPDLSKVTVEGYFWCGSNKLTSLKGAPREVGGDFLCDKNQLTSLHGSPREVGGRFMCHTNQLTTLQGASQKIGGNFRCTHNYNLSSLFGLPNMPEKYGISCDYKLREKYGCPVAEHGTICYKDLIESSLYKSELSAYKIRQKNKEDKKNAQARFKAGYTAFKKQFAAKEREE